MIKADKIATLDTGLITGEMGKMPDNIMAEVKQKLKEILELD